MKKLEEQLQEELNATKKDIENYHFDMKKALCSLFGVDNTATDAVFSNDDNTSIVFATKGCFHLEVKIVC